VTGWIYDFSKIATLLLLIGLLVHYFFFSILIVRGQSMEPNYIDGQVYAINRITYRLHMPQRGDAIAMFFPGETQKRFIKRVIGLPGETVSIQDGRVFINNQLLQEAYLPAEVTTLPNLNRILQSDEYFVMGDNRLVSSDSRAWGTVPSSFIIGKVETHVATLPSRVSPN